MEKWRENEQNDKSVWIAHITYDTGRDGISSFGKDERRSWALGCDGTVFFVFDRNKNGNNSDNM